MGKKIKFGKTLSICVHDNIVTNETLKLNGKDRNGGTLEKRIEKTKISGKTKRPTHESLAIDNIKGEKYHCVKEKDEKGNWFEVHKHRDIQKKNTA